MAFGSKFGASGGKSGRSNSSLKKEQAPLINKPDLLRDLTEENKVKKSISSHNVPNFEPIKSSKKDNSDSDYDSEEAGEVVADLGANKIDFVM